MELMQNKSKEFLKESLRHIQIADHIAYITFPIVNEKKLIIKIFEETAKALNNILSSAIYYEFERKNIILRTNEKENVKNFLKNLSKKYEINEKEIRKIQEIIEIEEKHRKSPMEFTKKEKVIILSDNLTTNILTIEQVKDYLTLTKNILKKILKKQNN